MQPAQQAEQLAEAEQRRRFVLLLVVRAAVITALLGSTLFFSLRAGPSGYSLTRIILYALAGAVFALTAGYAVWLRLRKGNLVFHIQVQVVFDVLIASVLVYITGGLESPFTFFYALPIVQTAVFFPRRGALMTAGLSCLLLGGLYVLESQGLVPVDLEGRVRIGPSASKVVYLLAFNYAVFLVIAWLAGGLGEQLRQKGLELQQTEEEVEALVALNRDIVLSLRSGLLALDPGHRVSVMNPVAEAILGCGAKQAIGRQVVEVFPALAGFEAREVSSDSAVALLREEVEHMRPNGVRVPVGLTLSPLTRADGENAGTLVHMQDLTTFKALEISMKRSERLAALGSMAAVLAHEIRNPLASISGAVQMLQDTAELLASERKLMDIILRETGRLDGLLSDFLSYARPKEPRLAWTDLEALVAETLQVFAQRDQAGHLRIGSELASVRARVDADQIRQVLFNLLNNAEQALEGSGEIRVVLRAQDGLAVLEVSDDGPGVDPQEQERVFEPFMSTKEQGTGLGLATVQQIIEAHGGRVELTCPQAGGSTFTIRLPVEAGA